MASVILGGARDLWQFNPPPQRPSVGIWPMPSRQQVLALAAACLALGLTSCGTNDRGQDETVRSAASCGAVLRIDGATYIGVGGLRRYPAVTGEEVEAIQPGCNDMGGEAPPDETVSAQVLREIGTDTALLFNGDVYVREGREATEQLTYWRTAPPCVTAGTFELSGTWLGVQGPHRPEHDGDIKLPYRVSMHVDEGPEEYVGAQVTVHADTSTIPALGPDDVDSTLWTGGSMTAEVHCDGDRFAARALTAEN